MKNTRFMVLLLAQSLAALGVVALIVLWKGPWDWKRWTGLALATPSVVLLLTARYQLGRSFSVTPQAQALVTRGLYSRIRNPMYVFSGLLVLGVALALPIPHLIWVWVVIVPTQIVRAHQEAKVLEEKFGDAYRQYRAGTWF